MENGVRELGRPESGGRRSRRSCESSAAAAAAGRISAILFMNCFGHDLTLANDDVDGAQIYVQKVDGRRSVVVFVRLGEWVDGMVGGWRLAVTRELLVCFSLKT